MKKRLMLALMLILCAALLAACSGDDKRYDVLTNNNGAQQNMNQQQSTPEEENPLAEEDDYEEDWAVELPTQVAPTATPAPTVRSQYAGATPVVLDPIDKPTPTAVPTLAPMTYTAYDAIKLGLSFEGPAGWQKDDSAADTFVIWNPNARINYLANLTLTAQQVSSDYSTSDLKAVINSMLDAIGDSGFDEYNPSQTDGRTLLGKDGVYANYNGTMEDGVQVSGRVHAVCVDRVLYTIHLIAPKAQWNDYKEMVYDHLRDTLTIVK